ncbi:hypothetical protein SASPL_117661 [Salvia splendens]|uniref:Uncharacterized protein n=1 Tax=Salvia splendens TaxID=180675 RepID=A0A8X8ZWI1_SALSN|nr:uncharacterized protein LOC121809713 [Salvia splendens]KAG6421112.1 hypothetical protein SASPL_117661 [Salvia splendens]
MERPPLFSSLLLLQLPAPPSLQRARRRTATTVRSHCRRRHLQISLSFRSAAAAPRPLSPRSAPATVAFPFVRVAAAVVHAQAAALASPLHRYYTTGSLPNTATATDSPLRQHHNHHLLSPDNG